MTQAVTAEYPRPNAWPIDAQARILSGLAGSNGVTAQDLSAKSGVALPIIVEWLTEKVQQRLIRFNAIDGTYCSLCRWPAVPKAVSLTGR